MIARTLHLLVALVVAAPLLSSLPGCLGNAGGTEPQPSDPTDPTDPTAPTEPSDPSDPTEPTDPGTAPVEEASVFFLGHSLIGWQSPPMVESLADDAGRQHSWDIQLGIGANLQWQWDRGAPEGVNAREVLPRGRFDTLVMTEAVPLQTNYEWAGTVEYAGRYYDLAQQSRPGTRVFFLQTWHSMDEGSFRARLDSDRALWERIVDEVNATRSGPPMLMIPAGTALGRLLDRMAAGEVPGLRVPQDLFVDDIHPNTLGFYLVACVHFATVYRMSPVGLTERVVDRYGTPLADRPTPEVARIMQEIAWEVVSTDPRAGVAAR